MKKKVKNTTKMTGSAADLVKLKIIVDTYGTYERVPYNKSKVKVKATNKTLKKVYKNKRGN